MTAVGFFQFSSRNFRQTGIISDKVRLAYLLAYSAASEKQYAFIASLCGYSCGDPGRAAAYYRDIGSYIYRLRSFFAADPDRERKFGYCTNIDLA